MDERGEEEGGVGSVCVCNGGVFVSITSECGDVFTGCDGLRRGECVYDGDSCWDGVESGDASGLVCGCEDADDDDVILDCADCDCPDVGVWIKGGIRVLGGVDGV